MSAQRPPIHKRHSSKKKDGNLRNNFENENPEIIEKSPMYRNFGFENYILSKLETVSPHFSDNPEMLSFVTTLKKNRRKERSNQLDSLTKEKHKKQKKQQTFDPHYLGNMNDDDLLIKSQERLRIKNNAHGSRSIRVKHYREGDDHQGNGVNNEGSLQMDDYRMNQKGFGTNRHPLDKLPTSQSQPSRKAFTPTPPPDVNTGVRNIERPKSKNNDLRDINYMKRIQEKVKRKQELELIRKHSIKEETNRRLRQLEEFRRKQRKEQMAKQAKNQELKFNDDLIDDDENKEIRKQQRRERMAEIARESRNPLINNGNNALQEQDNENIECWEDLTPDNIGWKDFLSVSKTNDKSQLSCFTDKTDKFQENISKALAPEQSFKQILKERYVSRPAISESEETLQVNDEKNELAKLAPQITQGLQKFSLNQPKLRQRIQEDDPLSLKPTQRLHFGEESNDNPQPIAKVQDWLKNFEEFEKPENGSKIPVSNHYEEGYSSSGEFSSDNETSAMGNSKSLLALLSKIRQTQKKINSRDKVVLERHQRTLEVMQRIVTDLIEKHEEIVERDKKIRDGKKHVKELLNTITGKNTRDIIDALSQSLDQPSDDIDATSNSLDTLLKQLQKAMGGLENVEGQLTRKEMRLKTALEISKDLVNKRLNLINWERRLRKSEQCVNEIASRIGESRDSSMVVNQDESYIGSVLGSFFGKKGGDDRKNKGDDMIKPRANSGPSRLQKEVYTEEDWEKILVRVGDNINENENENENNDGNSQSAEINQQNTKSDTTIQSSSEVNQMTVISQMDEYLLLLEKQEKMRGCLDKIEDNQQSIKDYLSKVDHNHGNNNSVINSEYFKPNITIEETEIVDATPVEEKLDKWNKEEQVNSFAPPTLPTFDLFTNENLLEIEPNIKDSDSDSDWEELTSRFKGLSCSRNKIVEKKSTNRISKSTPLKKFPKKAPTTESLVLKTPSWLKDDQDNKVNTSDSDFFVNSEGKLGGIFANVSLNSSAETVKDFQDGEIPKIQAIDVKNSTHNNVDTELRSDLNMGSLTTNQKDILTLEKSSSSLNLGDYVSRSFPVPDIPQQILESTQKEGIFDQTNSLEIPKYKFETQKHQEKEIDTNIEDKGEKDDDASDNDIKNDNEISRSESGLDFSEVVNNLPGWKSFVSLVRGNVDKKKIKD